MSPSTCAVVKWLVPHLANRTAVVNDFNRMDLVVL